MVRDPAVHIKRSDLVEILSSVNEVLFPEVLTDIIMQKAVKRNIRNRVIVTAKSRGRDKLKRTIAAEDQIVEKFNGIYNMMLQKHDIRSTQIHKTSSHYLVLKEIAKNAQECCEMFGEVLEEGFKRYVEIGLDLLKNKFTIYRLKGTHPKILLRYENLQKLERYEDEDGFKRMYLAWKKSLFKYHQLDFDVEDPDRLVAFIYAIEEASKLKAVYQDYMDAQFDKWSFLDSMPEFSQLYGENAGLAYYKYMASQKGKYSSEAERKYHEKVKSGEEIPIKKSKRKKTN